MIDELELLTAGDIYLLSKDLNEEIYVEKHLDMQCHEHYRIN